MTSAREHFKIKNTLVCLLKAIEGKTTQVELRNENVIVGTILCCDGYMNLTMKNVTFKPVRGKEVEFTDFYVQGKQIRYVHIPDEVDMLKAMEQHVKHRYEPPRQRGGARGRGGRGGRARGASRGGRGSRGGYRGGRGGRGRESDDKSAHDSLKRGGFAFGQGSRGSSSGGGSRR